VRALACDGWRIRILARRDPITPAWRHVSLEVVTGDLADQAALSDLCRGADLVIHNAGLVKAPSRAEFDRVNVEGSRQVAKAAQAAPHVILVSSLTAREPGLSHYSASKHGGEVAMRSLLGDRLTVARPCAIYGPGDRELLAVFQAADRLPVLPILSAMGRVTMIHVEDAARQVAALASHSPSGVTVALSDSHPDGYSWRDLMAHAAAACGTAPRFVRIPRALIQAIGVTNDFTALLGQVPMLTSAKARELLHPDWAILPIEQAIATTPPLYDLTRGFAHTVSWYRETGWMKQ
jgi:nucleoside-diphosphate-sugar epimerase